MLLLFNYFSFFLYIIAYCISSPYESLLPSGPVKYLDFSVSSLDGVQVFFNTIKQLSGLPHLLDALGLENEFFFV